MTGRVKSGDLGECDIVSPLRECDGYWVEVGVWSEPPAEPWTLCGTVIGDAGFTWARFWFPDQHFVIEKMFGRHDTVGYYVDIVDRPESQADGLVAVDLYVDLWVTPDGDVRTLDVGEFAAAAAGPLSASQVVTAVRTYATLRTRLAAGRFPPEHVTEFQPPELP